MVDKVGKRRRQFERRLQMYRQRFEQNRWRGITSTRLTALATRCEPAFKLNVMISPKQDPSRSALITQ